MGAGSRRSRAGLLPQRSKGAVNVGASRTGLLAEAVHVTKLNSCLLLVGLDGFHTCALCIWLCSLLNMEIQGVGTAIAFKVQGYEGGMAACTGSKQVTREHSPQGVGCGSHTKARSKARLCFVLSGCQKTVEKSGQGHF